MEWTILFVIIFLWVFGVIDYICSFKRLKRDENMYKNYKKIVRRFYVILSICAVLAIYLVGYYAYLSMQVVYV